MLAITDTGCGMTPKVRNRIFEPFFTTKEAGKGTGLGLATVYGIVKQNNGCIWVYSEPGRGTTFKIYIPLMETGRTEESAPAPSRKSLEGQETVLLVEDSAGVRGAARQILLRQGYQVLQCSDGDAALALLSQSGQEIHLLLTDIVMPGINGRELAARVQARCPGVRTLYMSGYPDQAVVDQGVLKPGMAYLQKPFSPLSLATKVRVVLDAT
jgi:CheY-like chemotaxis protein